MLFTLLIMLALSYSIVPTWFYKFQVTGGADSAKNNKELYITFDDGPEYGYTDKLLDLLLKYEVRATFFIVASKAHENRDLIMRMQQEGHLIGLHSLEHKNAIWRGPYYTSYDFKRSTGIMEELGIEIKYYRPPWGHFNLSTIYNLRKYSLKPILWDIMVGDWKKKNTPLGIEKSLIKQTFSDFDSQIICLHDGRGKDDAPIKMIEALENMLPQWQKAGFKFLRLDE